MKFWSVMSHTENNSENGNSMDQGIKLFGRTIPLSDTQIPPKSQLKVLFCLIKELINTIALVLLRGWSKYNLFYEIF